MLYAIRLVLVIAVAGLAVSAYAYDVKGLGGKRQAEDPAKSESNRRDSKERENAYRNALKAIPDGKANKDPWAGAR